jgi:hypothetical protein
MMHLCDAEATGASKYHNLADVSRASSGALMLSGHWGLCPKDRRGCTLGIAIRSPVLNMDVHRCS